MDRKKVIFIGLFLGIATALLSYSLLNNLLEDTVINPEEQVISTTDNNIEKDTILTRTEEKYKEWANSNRERALAVVIDNDINARPQQGLNKADVVYEFPIEGGATRFLAVYSRQKTDQIGPIRSARPYIVDLALEHSAIFVHAGGSEASLEYINKNPVNNLNALGGGVDRAFWRISDREMPHNLYSSESALRKIAKEQKFNSSIIYKDVSYASDFSVIIGDKGMTLDIYPQNKEYQVSYDYDEQEGAYFRRVGQKSTDEGSNSIYIPNIIIKFVPTETLDGEGRLNIEISGKGDALFFRGGKITKGSWTKKASSVTKYFDQTGKEIKFVKGPLWIHLINKNTRVDY